jgi:hypothetical protein
VIASPADSRRRTATASAAEIASSVSGSSAKELAMYSKPCAVSSDCGKPLESLASAELGISAP